MIIIIAKIIKITIIATTKSKPQKKLMLSSLKNSCSNFCAVNQTFSQPEPQSLWYLTLYNNVLIVYDFQR